MSSQTMTVTCVISLTRIRILTESSTLLIMSLTILSVFIYCVFFVKKMKKMKKMNESEKNKHFEKSSKLGGVAWM